MTVTKLSALVVTLGLAAASCGSGTDVATPDESPPSSLAASSSAAVEEEAASDGNQVTLTPSTTEPEASDSSPSTSSTQSPIYDIGPAAGQIMDVVGVPYDDVLTIRNQPSASGTIVTTAAPFAANPQIISGGSGQLVGATSAWWTVTVNGTSAWADASFLGQVSPNSEDLFPQIQSGLMSTTGSDLATLIRNIGGVLADGPTPSVVLSTEPVGLDAIGSEATIDVINIGDDALKGWRIQILFNNVYDDIDAPNPQIVGAQLISATGFPICARGLDAGTGTCL